MRIALAQLNFRIADFDGNATLLEAAIEKAKSLDVDLLVTSELAATGYPPQDLLERDDFISRNEKWVERVAAHTTSNFAIICGCAERNETGRGKPYFNSAVLCSHGKPVDYYQKCLLPTYDVFDEDRYFEAGGDVHPFEWKGRRIGITVCEDMWNDEEKWPHPVYHRDPVDEQAEHGVDFFVNLSASPYHTNKPEIRRDIVTRYASRHQRPFVYVSQVGGNDELLFDGRSMVVDSDGALIARARSCEDDLLIVDLPLDGAEEKPATGLDMPLIRPDTSTDAEEVYQALVMGVRDYFAKTGFSKAVLGLSGGIDSALTAAIAADALGPNNVLGVAMPSRYSSSHSKTDAEQLAENLGIDYEVISIEPVFKSLLASLAPIFEGTEEGVAEENLQARARGTILMGISNKFDRLLLSTGNKSELAVGYCTLYGDMNGAIAVISDLPKTLVYDVSRWLNESRDREVIPVSTLEKPPSAELRPDQKDQDSLPDYEVLDEIIRLYIKENLGVDAILERGFDREDVEHAIILINRNEYKRRQAAPGLKVTSRAFGQGRRYPLSARLDALLD
jgi:NAD+ synthetase